MTLEAIEEFIAETKASVAKVVYANEICEHREVRELNYCMSHVDPAVECLKCRRVKLASEKVFRELEHLDWR